MRKFVLILLLCFSAGSILRSQPALDTIRHSLQQPPKFFFRFDTKNSFIYNRRAQIAGVKAGVQFNRKLYFGIGYSQLYKVSDHFDQPVYVTGDGYPRKLTADLKMYYISLFAEYVFHQQGRWKLSMPLQLGIGETEYRYRYNSRQYTTGENTAFIYEPGVSVEYRILQWFGAGADIGYRFLLSADNSLSARFTSPTYSFKLLVYYSELYRMIFKKTK